MKKILLLLYLQIHCLLLGNNPFTFVDEPIDVVIPVHKKDTISLEYCISGIQKNCKNIRRIITISKERYTDNAEWINEDIFPFSLKDINKKLAENSYTLHKKRWEGKILPTAGWYYQQLLKLYAPFVIENISSNVLVVDADVIFLHPVYFLNKKNAGCYCYSTFENHTPYFVHAHRLLGNKFIRKNSKISGITNHMLMQKSVLEELFSDVEKLHHKDFWIAFCHSVDPKHLLNAGASEYELYFNYVFAYCPDVEIRPLKWINVANITPSILKIFEKDYDFVCWQSYLRKK